MTFKRYFQSKMEVTVPPGNYDPNEVQMPGEIAIDKAGKLIEHYISYNNFTGFRKDAYEAFLVKLWRIVHDTVIEFPGQRVTFRGQWYSPPLFNNGDKMTPFLARERRASYLLQLLTDVVTTYADGREEVQPKVSIGWVPLMTGTEHCYLKKKTPEELVAMGECPCDPQGIFIVKGKELTIPMKESLRYNKILLYSMDEVEVRMTCATIRGTDLVRIYRNKKGSFKLALYGFMKNKNKKDNSIGVLQMFRLLGMNDFDQIRQTIMIFTKPENRDKVLAVLTASFNKLKVVGNDVVYMTKRLSSAIDEVKAQESRNIRRRKKRFIGVNVPTDPIERLSYVINKELFPHINNEDPAYVPYLKIYLLAIMTVRLAEYFAGLRNLDNRDSWSNKQLRTDGTMMTDLFRSAWNKMIDDIRNGPKLKNTRFDYRRIKDDVIRSVMVDSFAGANWGISGIYSKQNIVEILKRESLVATYSHLTLINVKTSASSPISISMVQDTQYGFICPTETPDGEKVGIIKHTAITAKITSEEQEEKQYELRLYIKNLIQYSPNTDKSCRLILNGKFLGFVDGVTFKNHVINLRRKGDIPENTSVVHDENDNFVYVYTDEGRLSRPLLVINSLTGRLVIDELENGWNMEWDELMRNGAIEYIDPHEQEYILIAMTVEQTRENRIVDVTSDPDQVTEEIKKVQYTHCELDPSSLLGYAASTIPLPEHNQSPRNVFQAGMAKQALGIYHSNFVNRFDGTVKTLAFPSRPIFEPQINKIIGMNSLPSGQMVNVMFSTYEGFTQEDAFIFNKGSIDRGLFRIMKWYVYESIISTSKNEKFGRPPMRDGVGSGKYDAIDDNGFPILGSPVKEGMCVIGKISLNVLGQQVDASTYLDTGEEGRIDSYMVDYNVDGGLVIRVKIRHFRRPHNGDKFAPRNAQKGTLGLILSEENMPFSESSKIVKSPDGISSVQTAPRPDIIINPHCIPSRMTIAFLMEILASKAGALVGERINATAFRPFDRQRYERVLRDYGFNSLGNEVYYSGNTGRAMSVPMFTGPAYYQALRHHVLDKYQARHTGAVNLATHTPIGQSRRRGLRFGEMERDAAISHGATRFLQERLMVASSGYRTAFCMTCGSIAIIRALGETFSCNRCGNLAKFSKCEIPATFKLLNHLLNGMGFNISLQLMDSMDVQNKGMKRNLQAIGENELDILEQEDDEVEDVDEDVYDVADEVVDGE